MAAATVLVLCLSVPPAGAAPAPAKPYDFDGNGYVDLAIGAPTLRVGKVRAAGGVIVLPSSKSGPSRREKVITQSSRGVPGGSQRDDRFGYAVASADFNKDGYADLAVGQPGETIGRAWDAGRVTVIHGSKKGLDTTKSTTISQPGGARTGSSWGSALASLDANGDGYPDLAVGAPGSFNIDGGFGGSVTILPGGARGLSQRPATVVRGQPQPDDDPASQQGDVLFGAALATGDLDGDRRPDLVILSEGNASEGEERAGSVTACPARTGGLGACRRLLHDDALYGFAAVAVGNMSGDGVPEIAVGIPEFTEEPGPGAVAVLQLRRTGGLSLIRVTEIRQSSRGVPGGDEEEDGFGDSVAVGDIDRDGYADLVVGSPGENNERGQMTVVHGAAGGWRTTGSYFYSQNTRGIPGSAEKGDWFGESLTLLDHNSDGRLDLTIAAPGENGGSGAITTIPGSGKKFAPTKSDTFGLAGLGYRYPAGARFGEGLGR